MHSLTRVSAAVVAAFVVASSLAWLALPVGASDTSPGTCSSGKAEGWSEFVFVYDAPPYDGVADGTVSGDNKPGSPFVWCDKKGKYKKNEANIPQLGGQVHVSCSDTFPGGFSEKDGRHPKPGEPKILSYRIEKYDRNGNLTEVCPEGGTTTTTVGSTTTTSHPTTTTTVGSTTTTSHPTTTTTVGSTTTTSHPTTTTTVGSTTTTSHPTTTTTVGSTTTTGSTSTTTVGSTTTTAPTTTTTVGSTSTTTDGSTTTTAPTTTSTVEVLGIQVTSTSLAGAGVLPFTGPTLPLGQLMLIGLLLLAGGGLVVLALRRPDPSDGH